MPAYKAGKLWKFKISEEDEWIIKADVKEQWQGEEHQRSGICFSRKGCLEMIRRAVV